MTLLLAAPRGRRRLTAVARARIQLVCGALLLTATALAVTEALAVLTGWPDRPLLLTAVVALAVPVAVALGRVDRVLSAAPRVLEQMMVTIGLVLVASAVYLVVVVGFDGSPGAEERRALGLSIAATAVIAVVLTPARRWLERFAHLRVFGEHEDPEVALQTFAGRMSRAVPMDELLLQLAEILRKTMALARAEVWTGVDGVLELAVSVPDRRAPRLVLGEHERSVAARSPVAGNAWLAVWVPALLDGRAAGAVRAAPVAHMGELLGFIVVERAADEQELGEDEDRVLTDIARQLGLALHNVRLDRALQASLEELQVRNAELLASRTRIVAAADESRRRIERNLHDGAQQHLVAMAVKVGLARQLMDGDADTAAGMLEELRDDVQATLTELRELAHGIYPPLLRSQGLGEALAAAANRAVLPTKVQAGELPRFHADVEAAVYFCCLEAIQNAGKHAGGDAHVVVSLDCTDDLLSFEVADDGAGFDPASVSGGDGFVNMADRLGAIGGSLTVTSRPGAGTQVRGVLPGSPSSDSP